jgi:hypothetical protein
MVAVPSRWVGRPLVRRTEPTDLIGRGRPPAAQALAQPPPGLTDAGRALLPALEQITRWAEEHLPAADQSE